VARQPVISKMTKAEFRDVLLGVHPGLYRHRNLYKLIPSDPRCKLCNAPFGGVGAAVMPLVGRRQYRKNPLLCEACLNEPVEGVEVEITMLFADVRGSTALAERMSASEFSQLLNRFYEVATRVLIRTNAVIDKLVGDEVIGLYIPGFAGANHAHLAVHAAQELLHLTGHARPGGPWLPVGVGIHTGNAYVGLVGPEGGVGDLTALGDAMNIAARLGSLARAGEILISQSTYSAASLNVSTESRRVELKGRTEPVDVRVLKIGAG
jgi:adenylate cyclase